MFEQQPYGSDQNLRVGDAEREQTGDRLRQAHVEGRLDPEEFQDRLDRCYKAKTASELRELVADLPGEGRPQGRSSSRPSLLWLRTIPVLPILLAIFLISATVHGHIWWLLLPLFFLMRFRRWGRRGWRSSWGANRTEQRP